MMDKLISLQQAFDALHCRFADGFEEDRWWNSTHVIAALKGLPAVQPEIIRCKDCEYLCNEDGLRGMCWHINGFGTDVKDKYNSFCSWAERREDG